MLRLIPVLPKTHRASTAGRSTQGGSRSSGSSSGRFRRGRLIGREGAIDMGAYLDKPSKCRVMRHPGISRRVTDPHTIHPPLVRSNLTVTTKESLETEAHGLKFGAAAMQVVCPMRFRTDWRR